MNPKHFLIVFFLWSVSLDAGCSTVGVQEHAKAKFDKIDTVTVISTGVDNLGLQGELEYILLSRGYDVVSQEVASQKAKLDVDVDYSNNKVKGGAEVYKATEVKSVYVLSFAYSSRFDGQFREEKINKLYGSLIDLRTGKIVKSLKIERSIWALKGNTAFLEALVDQMQ
ncbi:MAG: hypothetical protein PHN49_02930 [Candidatus Omnitrophica bacterium]|nr:hypothetical protein [Candidatus Omnitrophota bacterium]MDD5670574.1 hypothetical protein [Candidatus Omnitrophota bacterium]